MRDQLDEYRELFAAGSKADSGTGTGTGRGSSRTFRYLRFKYNDQII